MEVVEENIPIQLLGGRIRRVLVDMRLVIERKLRAWSLWFEGSVPCYVKVSATTFEDLGSIPKLLFLCDLHWHWHSPSSCIGPPGSFLGSLQDAYLCGLCSWERLYTYFLLMLYRLDVRNFFQFQTPFSNELHRGLLGKHPFVAFLLLASLVFFNFFNFFILFIYFLFFFLASSFPIWLLSFLFATASFYLSNSSTTFVY